MQARYKSQDSSTCLWLVKLYKIAIKLMFFVLHNNILVVERRVINHKRKRPYSPQENIDTTRAPPFSTLRQFGERNICFLSSSCLKLCLEGYPWKERTGTRYILHEVNFNLQATKSSV